MKNHNVRTGSVLNTIKSIYDSFTPSSKRIADYISVNAERIKDLSISELSGTIKVGEATIIRFCRTLGFSGYQDFKLQLAIEMSTINDNHTILDTVVTPEDSTEIISKKLQSSIEVAISETINLLDFSGIEKTAEQFKKANSVSFFGIGSSGIVAESAKYKFMRIGMNVDAFSNNHLMYIKASLLKKGDIAFAISHSGESAETIKSMRIAKDSGAITIGIMHNPRSALSEYCDIILVNGNKQTHLQGDSIGTKTSQLFVLDLVYTLIVKSDMAKTSKTKQKTAYAIGS